MPVGKAAALALFLLALCGAGVQAQGQAWPGPLVEAAPQGFGDHQNSTVWSMQWWQGKLYVGTMRSFICRRAAIQATSFPLLADFLYPPAAADADCPLSPANIPLRAEIWRWTPETDSWERVYQSPQDVPIPGYVGKNVARDTGYRGMLIFEEPGGTEALYVAGVSAREIFTPTQSLPPARLLRTTDGLNFQAVPQDPGTFLGNLSGTSLRTGTVYRDRMYLTSGSARGEGILIEAENPAAGNDNFREVGPPGQLVWDAVPFNGFLYVGVASWDGFSVVKTDAQGTPPYTYTPVIQAGGYLTSPSPSVVSFQEYQGKLYVGTYSPAELYRINPDDTWDLIMGRIRDTPTGRKVPLSGLDPGFGWPFNVQIYRMHAADDGYLYLGTLDTSRDLTEIIPSPELDAQLRPYYGFDLYRTKDGISMEPVTTNGFGDEFQVAARTFASTPYGMFLGTGSYWYGLRIWRQLPSSNYRVILPLVMSGSAGAT